MALTTEDIQRVGILFIYLCDSLDLQSPDWLINYKLCHFVQMLEENYIYIKTIVDQQNLGRLPQMQE